MTRTRIYAVILGATLVAGTGAFAAAAAAPGNSGAAKSCQQGGYQNLRRADQSTFSNTGECVSYAAHGGALTAPAKPVDHCASTLDQPGNYILVKDLVCGPQPGVYISASDVTFLMAGHTIDSQALSIAVGRDALTVGPAAIVNNVTVAGPGTVSGGNDEMFAFYGATHSTVRDVTATSGRVGFFQGYGGSHDNTFLNNTANGLGNYGFDIFQGDNDVLANNTCNGNGYGGIVLGQFYYAGEFVTNASVHGNTCANNGIWGVQADQGLSGAVISSNTATGNGAFDLYDVHNNCDANTWSGNTFITAYSSCIS